ncbi:MAG: FecR domain-containing protein [Ferruginibacter sp.]
MDVSRLEYLFESYISRQCSAEEEKELMALLTRPGNETIVETLIGRVIQNTESEMELPEQDAVSILRNILQSDKTSILSIDNKKPSRFPWIKIAAAVIFFVSGIAFWLQYKKANNVKSDVTSLSHNKFSAVPGGNHATLTMADGSTIVLDTLKNGKIQNGIAKINKQNGLLVFDVTAANIIEKVYLNTLATPRGGQYKVILSDGTAVWLNASSSLRFPSVFIGKQREVELTGEGYFEVKPLTPQGWNSKMPFMVKILSNSGQDMGTVKVLGTHFNINAYADDDAIRTSLLEGSVKITKYAASGLLKPGQQGVLKMNDNNIEIRNADMNEVVAWKNGLFQFDGADITAIMNQIGRWYDVDIVYAGKVPVRSFEGKISRDAQLSEVLQILELSNVKFTLEGKKIIVQ